MFLSVFLKEMLAVFLHVSGEHSPSDQHAIPVLTVHFILTQLPWDTGDTISSPVQHE